MKKFLFFVLSLIFTIAQLCIAQSDFPKLKSGGIAGLTILKETYYDGNSLWGYIDGGADLYLEYGFKKLLHQEADLNGAKYKVDIFNMSDAESAFGIFSVFALKCNGFDSNYRHSCISKYQYQAVAGDYYISIINEKGAVNSETDSRLLMKNIITETNTFSFPPVYKSGILKDHIKEVKYYKGILGIQNSIPEWEGIFGNIIYYSFYNLSFETNTGSINIAHITFSNKSEMEKFAARYKLDLSTNKKLSSSKRKDKLFNAWRIADNIVLLTETDTKEMEKDGLIKQLDQFVKENY